jgi:hypothetical protein
MLEDSKERATEKATRLDVVTGRDRFEAATAEIGLVDGAVIRVVENRLGFDADRERSPVAFTAAHDRGPVGSRRLWPERHSLQLSRPSNRLGNALIAQHCGQRLVPSTGTRVP